MFLFASLLGCAQLDQAKDVVDGLTNPLIFEGVALGVAPVADDRVDLSGTDFDQSAAALITLADAADVADIANAPVTGADVSIVSDSGGRVHFADAGDGTYTADSEDGLTYDPGAPATVSMTAGGEESSVTLTLPPAPDPGLPANAPPNQPLAVNLNGQGFDNVLVVVLDGATGAVTYDNRPDSIQDLYDLTHGEGELAVQIPGGAIPDESVYLVGVAGLVNADASQIENANTALSAMMAGRLAFSVVSTMPQ